MPLVRVEVRNEYGLGAPEICGEANREEPKEILEGIAVAGLVGFLRQLGDLADFAAEIFHGLQEEVMRTSSRSHKLMHRVRRIEAALSPLERAVLAQRSHLHFAYTPGSNWHAHIKCKTNMFVYSDVPQFILDSYVDCRDPPRLHLLDRFDPSGPGSCLKRYSDPTLFKKASAASGEVSAEKVPKDKNEGKFKKLRSLSRNEEVSQGASFSYHDGSNQFSQLNAGRHPPSSQTMSSCDTTLRSDSSELSNLDLRNGLGYFESNFGPNYSMQPIEEGTREFISSPVKRHDSDNINYNFLEAKNTTDAYGDVWINLKQEQVVTCDGKTTKLKPAMQDYDHSSMIQEDDHHRALESFSAKFDGETLRDNAVNFETVDKLDVQTGSQALPMFESGNINFDGFESETDLFVDALNSIELESETNIYCMRKHDMDHYSMLDFEDKAADHIQQNLECQISNSESNVLANTLHINGSCGDNPLSRSQNSLSAASCSTTCLAAMDEYNELSPLGKSSPLAQRAGESFNPLSPQSIGSHGIGGTDDGANVKYASCMVSSDIREERSGMPITGNLRSSSESQKPAPETSDDIPVSFWTNGGLLGLQPSKPPDTSLLKDLSQDPASMEDGKIISASQHYILSNQESGKPDKTESFKTMEGGPSTGGSTCQESQEIGSFFRKICCKISPSDLDVKLGRAGDSLHQNNVNSTGASLTPDGNFLPVNPEYHGARKPLENTRSSSQIFGIGNRLLNSNKKILHGGDEDSKHASYQNANAFEYQTFSGQTKDLFGGQPLITSPSSSPPLAHMKISFQPIASFEISKLKLKFPCINTNDERCGYIFPSFQLVPEESIARQSGGSDSDDDTFYRSSPSMLDGCHSHQSESISEQWESGESPSSKDPDLCDALCGISFTESVSTNLENGKASHGDLDYPSGLQFSSIGNRMQNSRSSRSFDLLSLNTLDHSFREELRNDTNSKVLVEPKNATTPDLPPLPPVKWRGIKPHLDDMRDGYEVMPEVSDYAFYLNDSPSTICQPPKPAPFNHDQISDTTKDQRSQQFFSQNSIGQREANKGKSIDEKEDFLQLIRTKSFNLRPTVTAKPPVPSGSPANAHVTAILEKANSIRQAVSDDAEDDGSWSDS